MKMKESQNYENEMSTLTMLGQESVLSSTLEVIFFQNMKPTMLLPSNPSPSWHQLSVSPLPTPNPKSRSVSLLSMASTAATVTSNAKSYSNPMEEWLCDTRQNSAQQRADLWKPQELGFLQTNSLARDGLPLRGNSQRRNKHGQSDLIANIRKKRSQICTRKSQKIYYIGFRVICQPTAHFNWATNQQGCIVQPCMIANQFTVTRNPVQPEMEAVVHNIVKNLFASW